MVKDYSGIPCDIKLINNTDRDILARIGYIIDDIIAHNSETIVHVDNSEVWAHICGRAIELGLEVEVVDPGPVPPPPPPVEPTILEKGKNYMFRFKSEVPELEDEAAFNKFIADWDLITVSEDEGNNWAVMDGDLMVNSAKESLYEIIYEPAFKEDGVGGWTERGAHEKMQGPKVTFENVRLFDKGGVEVDTFDLSDLMFLFLDVTEIPEN